MKLFVNLLLVLAAVVSVQSSNTDEPITDLKIYTVEELANFNGQNESLPLLFAVVGDVFDVTSASSMYGKDGDYNLYAGKDITRAIAIWTKNVTEIDRGMDLKGLDMNSIMNLNKMVKKFKEKYPIVGMMDYKEGGLRLKKERKEQAELKKKQDEEEINRIKNLKQPIEEVVAEEIIAEEEEKPELKKVKFSDESAEEKAEETNDENKDEANDEDKDTVKRTTHRTVTTTEL